MNQTQALSKLKAVLGSKFEYRIDSKAPDAAERERRRLAYKAAAEAERVARDAATARLAALMKGDAEYQSLRGAVKAAERHKDSLPSDHDFRITVGRNESIFFSVKAQGDTWDEVVSKLCTQPERV